MEVLSVILLSLGSRAWAPSRRAESLRNSGAHPVWIALGCAAALGCGSADEDLFPAAPVSSNQSSTNTGEPAVTPDEGLEDSGESPDDSWSMAGIDTETQTPDNGVDDGVSAPDDDTQSEPQDDDILLPEALPEPSPRIVSVSPEDGATGVFAEAPVVITFDTSMNRAQTEAAYQSEGIPSGSVSFTWNDASTQLTITPNAPLEYDSGTDPETVVARSFQFFISSSARDTDGNLLSAPFESSFSILRRIEGTVSAVQDRDLTGSFRSNDTYGEGQ